MDDLERQRWETLFRTLRNLVAQMERACPTDRYTLDIRIVPRERSEQTTR